MDANDNTFDAGNDATASTTAPAATAEVAATDAPEVSTEPLQSDTGVALIASDNGIYPANHRLRAEAMARDGVTTDKDGMIGDDLIASTKDRLKREDAEAEANTPAISWTRDRLVEFAASTPGATHEPDATKRVILDAITAATAAPSES